MSVTHIAGPLIEIGRRKIQRCPVCGFKLADNLAWLQGRIAVASTREEPSNSEGFLHWEVGCLVQMDGNRSSVVPHDDGTNLPDDSCIELVEED